MIDVRALVQTVLDTALYPDVRVFWLRKQDGKEPDEYVVYTFDGDSADAYADDMPLVRNANATIRYYYRDSMIADAAGRTAIKARERQIAEALINGGWSLPNGYFDAGDIDDVGYGTTVFGAYYGRVV